VPIPLCPGLRNFYLTAQKTGGDSDFECLGVSRKDYFSTGFTVLQAMITGFLFAIRAKFIEEKMFFFILFMCLGLFFQEACQLS
jgi:hypothetical protein